MSKVKPQYDIKFDITVEDWNNKRSVRPDIWDIKPLSNIPMSLSDLRGISDYLGESSFEEGEIAGLDLSTLDDDCVYSCEGTAAIEDTSFMTCDGMEHDNAIHLWVTSCKKNNRIMHDLESWPDTRHYGKFHMDGGPAGESIAIRQLNEKDLMVEIRYNCFCKRRKISMVGLAGLIDAKFNALQDSEWKRDSEILSALRTACQYLKEGKEKFSPGTTNSYVDEFLNKWYNASTGELIR